MKYILDFDHTLYDTSRFVEQAAPYIENGVYVTPAIWDIFDASTFLYKDVIPFLKEHNRDDITILTAMSPSLGPLAREFQKAKLEKSGVIDFVSEIVFMEGEKGSFVKELCTSLSTVFVDDTLSQLLSAQEHCEEVMLVQMIRPGFEDKREKDETIPVVSSLETLDALFS